MCTVRARDRRLRKYARRRLALRLLTPNVGPTQQSLKALSFVKFIAVTMLALAVAACSSTETQRPSTMAPPAAAAVQTTGSLLGLSSAAVLTRLGTPVLQVREGDGLMLQYRAPSCILDAYVYPTDGGASVTHVDARDSYGRDVDREACIAAVERAR